MSKKRNLVFRSCPPIVLAVFWSLAGFLVVYSPVLFSFLFFPVCFPLSLLVGLPLNYSPNLNAYIRIYGWLLILLPAHNLVVGYAVGLFLRKYRERAFLKRFLWGVRILILIILLVFLSPIFSSLFNREILELGRTLEKMRRAEIAMIPAHLNAATYYREAVSLINRTGFKELCRKQSDLPLKSSGQRESTPNSPR